MKRTSGIDNKKHNLNGQFETINLTNIVCRLVTAGKKVFVKKMENDVKRFLANYSLMGWVMVRDGYSF